MLSEHLKSWINHTSPLFVQTNSLFVLATILIVGYVCSRLARKWKIPSITAQIIGGILIGHYVLNLFPEKSLINLNPIINFALGFIGLAIGSHLNFRKLHNSGKRIFLITLFDVIITPGLVFVGFYYLMNISFEVSVIVAAISVTTAPGSTLHIIHEKRAKGILSKTILAVVALNNVVTVFLFYLVYYFLKNRVDAGEIDILVTLSKPLIIMLESVIVGSIVGFSLIFFTEKRRVKTSFLALVILAVVLTAGTSEFLHLSGLLSCLIMGMVITNFSKFKSVLFGAFKDLEVEVFTLFFVLAGTHLDFNAVYEAGLVGLAFIVLRLIGKTLGPALGAYMASSTVSIKKYIGISLYPFAGLAIGFTLFLENDPLLVDYSDKMVAIILTAVVVNEVLGPIFTGLAISKSNEENKNRIRLMDFLQEEYIKVNLQSNDKWQALDELAEFMFKTHKITEISLDQLKKSIHDREMDLSTGVGENLAIPHAIIEGGPKIRGVIGISSKGIDFDSIDGKPVYIIFLIATPENQYKLHLHMLANIAKIFGHHPHIKDSISKSKNADEVFEILQSEEVEELNPFFED